MDCRGVSRRNRGKSLWWFDWKLCPENGTFFFVSPNLKIPKVCQLLFGWWFQICLMLLIPKKTHVSDGLKPPTSSSCVCFSWWCFTDSTMINHKIKPPFGRKIVWTFFQASQASKSKVHFDPEKKKNTTLTGTYGCFLKWWYLQNTPNWSCSAGKPLVVGETHHFRKHPYPLTSLRSEAILELGGVLKNLFTLQSQGATLMFLSNGRYKMNPYRLQML